MNPSTLWRVSLKRAVRLTSQLLLLTLTLVMLGCASVGPTTANAPALKLPSTTPERTVGMTERTPPTPPTRTDTTPPSERPALMQLRPQSHVGLLPPTDIWERMRRGFAMPDLQSDLVRDRERWYTARPDYMLRMTERARRYLFHIVEELERRQMPTELALLPFIESAFDPEAVSRAKAMGMWQFMPATGKSFDLKQTLFQDDRRDVLESTRAALDYLQRLYTQFGDWHLALAAYNWGEGNVSRAIARNKARGKEQGYTDLPMPQETRWYVPKFQAMKNIVAQPNLFNVQLPAIDNHPYFKSVGIERDIDVTLAAQLAQVPLDDFKALNPQMNRPVILAAGTPQILLPWANAEIFERNLLSHGNRVLASWTAWTSPKTMKVEEAAQEVGMTASQLRAVNRIPLGMLIKAGSTLLVPRKGHLDNDVSEATADNAQLNLTPEAVLKKLSIQARKGDTLTSLGARHGVSAANLAQWNKLPASAALKAGQSLVIFVPSQGTRGKGTASSASKPVRKSAPAKNNTRR